MTDQEIIVEKYDAPWCDKCHCFHWHLGVNWVPSTTTANTRVVEDKDEATEELVL